MMIKKERQERIETLDRKIKASVIMGDNLLQRQRWVQEKNKLIEEIVSQEEEQNFNPSHEVGGGV